MEDCDRYMNEVPMYERVNKIIEILVSEVQVKEGGILTREEIKETINKGDKGIPKGYVHHYREASSGYQYKMFSVDLHKAEISLEELEYIEIINGNSYRITEKGKSLDIETEDVNEIRKKGTAKRNRRKKMESEKEDDIKEEDGLEDIEYGEGVEYVDVTEQWRDELLSYLHKMNPYKFEKLGRQLLVKMGVRVDEEVGVKRSRDGGIDGYGYITGDDFRTTRVAIQVKRYQEENGVSSSMVDMFRGAMDKHRTDYGIFVTTSYFTKDAIKASLEGSRVITLIDGEALIDLIAEYELHVKPVTVYEIGDFYINKEE